MAQTVTADDALVTEDEFSVGLDELGRIRSADRCLAVHPPRPVRALLRLRLHERSAGLRFMSTMASSRSRSLPC